MSKNETFTGYGFLEKWDREPDRELAHRIRELRVEEEASWRGVASAIYDEFDGNWMPKGNQLAGMDLCDWAASQFGEHYMDDNWN